MTVLRSIIMAFSLFSRVPVPQIDWKPESMRFMMAAFPLIGVVTGALIGLWVALCCVLGANQMIAAVGVTVLPILVTGGIHLDGFCDVVDAQSSHAEPERKREILRDPHIGAFAAIGVTSYLLVYFAFATQLDFDFAHAFIADASCTCVRMVILLALVHMLTRTGSGIATTIFPKSGKKGMLAMEHDSANTKPVVAALCVIAALCIAGAIACMPVAGITLACCWAVSLGALYVFAQRAFGGMSGDIAGFYLQSTELVMIIALAVVQLLA